MLNSAAVAPRTREPNIVLWTLPGPIWVQCPRCARPARVQPPRNRWRPGGEVATLSCQHCGLSHRNADAFSLAKARTAHISNWWPRCGHCGRDVVRDRRLPATRRGTTLSVRTRCAGCKHITTFPASPAGHEWREGFDPYFDLPLFLTGAVGRDLLWAWNPQHIALLATWLGATLRERSTQPYHWSMVSRLPRWMKLAAARPRVMRALYLLRERAVQEGLT